jgi:hypothetical protein
VSRTTESRLQAKLVEAHHRTKNILQSIVSYINILKCQSGELRERDLSKLSHFVLGLASLQSIMQQSVSFTDNEKCVQAAKVLQEYLESSPIRSLITVLDFDEEVVITPKETTSLLIITNEVLDSFLEVPDTLAEIRLNNYTVSIIGMVPESSGNDEILASRQLKLALLLAERDPLLRYEKKVRSNEVEIVIHIVSGENAQA